MLEDVKGGGVVMSVYSSQSISGCNVLILRLSQCMHTIARFGLKVTCFTCVNQIKTTLVVTRHCILILTKDN